MKLGFIGLGIMGKPMCKNLIRAGYELIIYSRNQETQIEMKSLGVLCASTPKQVAEQVEVVITVLPDSPDLLDVIFNENGLIEGFKKGSVLIDMSSGLPDTIIEVSSRLKLLDVRMLDAPVSGGEKRAIDGTLTVMVGGDKELFEQCYNILCAMSSSVNLIGDIGSGGIAKLANQIIVGLNLAAMSEALVFAKRSGVKADVLYQAIRGGAAGSTMLDLKAPMIFEQNYEAGFRLNLHLKDLKNAITTAEKFGAKIPLTDIVFRIMLSLQDAGLGDFDNSILFKYYEDMI